MECIFPGRILVGPGPETEGPEFLAEQLRGEFGSDFEREFGIDDVLRANDLEPPPAHVKRMMPFVARVPEGGETEIAARAAKLTQGGAAIPDYQVRPGAAVTFDDAALDRALRDLGARPVSRDCGRGCTVGILDSGVDSSLLPGANLHPRQYDALAPTASGLAPSDSTGHGSLVARIVSAVAPGATLLSVKTFDKAGSISSVIAALYLAQSAGPCDVLNLSLSVSCAPEPCLVCQSPVPAAANIAQLGFFFRTFMQGVPDSILVAAAGNNVRHLTMPAAFAEVIAVGSFDYSSRLPISVYHLVPANRFVLAPGGESAPGKAYGERPGFGKPGYLHGTSFAVAFVTGFAATLVRDHKLGLRGKLMQRRPLPPYGSGLLATVLGELAARSDAGWRGFDRNLHGHGALRF